MKKTVFINLYKSKCISPAADPPGLAAWRFYYDS